MKMKAIASVVVVCVLATVGHCTHNTSYTITATNSRQHNLRNSYTSDYYNNPGSYGYPSSDTHSTTTTSDSHYNNQGYTTTSDTHYNTPSDSYSTSDTHSTSDVYSLPENYGVDISQPVDTIDNFQCMRNRGYNFVIVRAYKRDCTPDYAAGQSIAHAHGAGIRNVDVYMEPSPTCSKGPHAQVREMISSLGNHRYNKIWLVVRNSHGWHPEHYKNRSFFIRLLYACKLYKPVGIHSNMYDWTSTFGNSYYRACKHQLWYSHHDKHPSFRNYVPFGGWMQPSLKQYEGDATVCNVPCDLNCS